MEAVVRHVAKLLRQLRLMSHEEGIYQHSLLSLIRRCLLPDFIQASKILNNTLNNAGLTMVMEEQKTNTNTIDTYI